MKIAVTWQMCGYVDIPNVTSIESAMIYFENNSDYIKLPANGEYVDGSFELSADDPDEMEAMCNL